MTTKDPVCGKEVDPLRARAVGIFGGVTYYFCSPECKSRFADPRKAPRAEVEPISKPPESKAKLAAGPSELKSETKPIEAQSISQSKAEAKPPANDDLADDEPLAVARSSARVAPWVIVLTLLAAGVVLFFLGRR